MAKCKETDGWINVDVIPPRGLRILGDALEAFVERMAVAANQRRVMKDKEGLGMGQPVLQDDVDKVKRSGIEFYFPDDSSSISD